MDKKQEAIKAMKAALRAIVMAEQAAEDAGCDELVTLGLAQAYAEVAHSIKNAGGKP